MTTQEDLLYTSGLFDGEGCVTILHETHGRTLPYMRTSLGSTNRDIILWLCEQYKGSFSSATLGALSKKPFYNFRLNGHRAARFLEQIEPYLKIKKAQAELAIEFQALKRGINDSRQRLPDTDRDLQETFAQRMHQLND